VGVGGIEPHGFGELRARGLGVAGLQQGVRQILPDVGAPRGEGGGLVEERDRGVVVARAQSVVGFRQRLIGGILFGNRTLPRRRGREQEKQRE